MLHISKHSGKMENFFSLSTSAITNEFCQAMRKNPDTICSKCYSVNYEKMRSALEEHLVRNSELLSKPLADSDIPNLFNMKHFRINSFGELINKHHLDNIVKIAKFNPSVTITLWTKRVNLIEQMTEKPDNLIIIISSPFVNVPTNATSEKVDKVFTVYNTNDQAVINCAKKCNSCLKCYTKEDETFFINEHLK